MIRFEEIDAYNSPLPNVFRFECHPKGAVAQDADGIRSVGILSLLERPSSSSAATEGVPHAVPEAVAFEGHVLDEDLHPSDEPLRHRRSRQQPQALDAVREHGEEGQSANRIPVSHAKVFDPGFLFPHSYPFFNIPS
jgi:hypothetical protein